MKKIQAFLGVEHEITRDDFLIPKNEDGTDGTPCFIEDENTEANCIGKGASEKGRSLDKNFSLDVAQVSFLLLIIIVNPSVPTAPNWRISAFKKRLHEIERS